MKMLFDGILANIDVLYLQLYTLFKSPDLRLDSILGGYTNFYFDSWLVEFGGPEGSTIYRVTTNHDGTFRLYMYGDIEYSKTPLYVHEVFSKFVEDEVEEILL